HQCSQRITNHGLVVYGEKLLADDFRERVKARPRAAGEKNGFLHFGFSIFAFRLLALQRISNSAHSCQKRVPAVKSIPLFWLTRPSACCGAERNVVLSTINELSRANFRSLKRPPTHSDNAF